MYSIDIVSFVSLKLYYLSIQIFDGTCVWGEFDYNIYLVEFMGVLKGGEKFDLFRLICSSILVIFQKKWDGVVEIPKKTNLR